MESDWARSFAHPDDVIDDPLVREEVVRIGEGTVGRFFIRPGFRWSQHVKPLKGTDWCEARHVGVCLGGRLTVALPNGDRYTIEAGQVFEIPSLHDIWVEGDETVETIEWAGALSWHPGPEGLGERVLTTLMLSDIVDSTSIAETVGADRWEGMLRSHDALSADVINRYHGRVVKHTGDGALAIFASPANAVRASRALVEAVPPLGLRLRVGIHTGEVTASERDVHGLAVHEAARVTAVARPSQIVASGTTALLAGDLAGSFRPLGPFDLKGITGPRELFEVVA